MRYGWLSLKNNFRFQKNERHQKAIFYSQIVYTNGNIILFKILVYVLIRYNLKDKGNNEHYYRVSINFPVSPYSIQSTDKVWDPGKQG